MSLEVSPEGRKKQNKVRSNERDLGNCCGSHGDAQGAIGGARCRSIRTAKQRTHGRRHLAAAQGLKTSIVWVGLCLIGLPIVCLQTKSQTIRCHRSSGTQSRVEY